MINNSGERLLEAVAYGDAAGLPVETWTHEQIEERYGRIETLLPSSENPFFIGEFEPGAWSDDTQLSIAVARSLARVNGFDIHDMIKTHIEAFDETPEVEFKGKTIKRGWGRSTTTALRRLKKGIPPTESGLVGGAGNGILMKQAPLAYWHAARDTPPDVRYRNIDQLTKMTHDSDDARVSARVHDDVLVSLINEGYDAEMFIATAKAAARRHEWGLYAEPVMTNALRYLHPDVTQREILNHTDAKGFFAPQTLAMAYGALIANRARFKESVYGAVNLGGDTDSIASITGAMSLFADSSQELSADAAKLHEVEKLRQYSLDLAQAAAPRND